MRNHIALKALPSGGALSIKDDRAIRIKARLTEDNEGEEKAYLIILIEKEYDESTLYHYLCYDARDITLITSAVGPSEGLARKNLMTQIEFIEGVK
jgi:hypothetical protein